MNNQTMTHQDIEFRIADDLIGFCGGNYGQTEAMAQNIRQAVMSAAHEIMEDVRGPEPSDPCVHWAADIIFKHFLSPT